KELLRPIAARSSIVLSGLEEGRYLSGRDDCVDVAEWFQDLGAELVVIKDGRHGSYAMDGSGQWRQEAMPIRVVDPVGAGDAFAAGFLSARLRGEPVSQCLREAAAV